MSWALNNLRFLLIDASRPSLEAEALPTVEARARTVEAKVRPTTEAEVRTTVEAEAPRKSRIDVRRKSKRERPRPDGPVEVGLPVPDFSLVGVDGEAHRLSDFRGRKVMLCFYRYSTCPSCAYTISKFIGHYKKLAWASRLTVITVFQTDIESLRRGLRDADAPIRRLTGISEVGYPFLGLADPDGTAAAAFGVDRREFARRNSLLSSGVGVLQRGEAFLLPSEFLIDEDGVLRDVMKAKKKEEAMAMSRVDGFLTRGFERQAGRRHVTAS